MVKKLLAKYRAKRDFTKTEEPRALAMSMRMARKLGKLTVAMRIVLRVSWVSSKIDAYHFPGNGDVLDRLLRFGGESIRTAGSALSNSFRNVPFSLFHRGAYQVHERCPAGCLMHIIVDCTLDIRTDDAHLS
jgi:hypothetical protein